MYDRILHSRWGWALLVAILLLAAFLRVYQLDVIPPGLHYDEAFDAVQARDILRGLQHPIFFPENNGEEPAHIYLEALVFALIGQSEWAARLSGALLGFLVVPALYFCARAFFPDRPPAGVAAALIGAFLYWALNFSRIGLLTTALPAVLTASAGAVVLAFSTRSFKWAATAGLLVGLTLYTYLASRLWPFALALWLLYLLVWHRSELTSRASLFVVMGLSAGLAVSPLAFYFLNNPLAFTARAGQVLQVGGLGWNALLTGGMFFLLGDADPRDNLPWRPALDPILAVLFLIGLLVSIRRFKRPPYALLFIWLLFLSLPSVLTEYAPTFRRAIGAMPPTVLICSLGVDWLWGMRGRLAPRVPEWAAGAVLATVLILSASLNVGDYFLRWGPGSGLYYSFDEGILRTAQALAASPAGDQLCLSPDYHDHPTVLWALDGRPFISFDGRKAVVLPDTSRPTTCAVITYEDKTNSPARFFPSAEALVTIYDFENKPYSQLYRIPAGSVPNLDPQHPLTVQLGTAVSVLGYDLIPDGTHLGVRIYWRAEQKMSEDYTAFVHLLGLQDPHSDSLVAAQDDAQPGHGTFPTSRWRPGQTIIDNYTLDLPDPNVPYQLEFGLYNLSTGQRLPAWQDGQRLPDDRVLSADIK